MHLNCPDEVARYVGATLRDALSDPLVLALIGDHHMRIRIGLVDPDCVLYMDTKEHDVRMGEDTDATDGLIAMDGDTALAYLLGRVDLETAIESGTVVAAGETQALLRLLGNDSPLPDVCERVLRREGRSDLLALAG